MALGATGATRFGCDALGDETLQATTAVRAIQRACVFFLDGIGGDLWPDLVGPRRPIATRAQAVNFDLTEDMEPQYDEDEIPPDSDDDNVNGFGITDADAGRLATVLTHIDRDDFPMGAHLDYENEQDEDEHDSNDDEDEDEDEETREPLVFSQMAGDISENE